MKASLALLASFSLLLPLAAKEGAPEPVNPGANQQLKATLQSKTFAKVEFHDSTLAECLAWLKAQGLPIELSPAAAKQGKDTRITLTLHDVPAIEALKYVTNLASLKYVFDNGKIHVQPLD